MKIVNNPEAAYVEGLQRTIQSVSWHEQFSLLHIAKGGNQSATT
jgi:hypothetical protein